MIAFNDRKARRELMEMVVLTFVSIFQDFLFPLPDKHQKISKQFVYNGTAADRSRITLSLSETFERDEPTGNVVRWFQDSIDRKQ